MLFLDISAADSIIGNWKEDTAFRCLEITNLYDTIRLLWQMRDLCKQTRILVLLNKGIR